MQTHAYDATPMPGTPACRRTDDGGERVQLDCTPVALARYRPMGCTS